MPVFAWQRSRAAVRRMRYASVPLRPATASEVANAGPDTSEVMWSSSRTTWRGVVRLPRERPEPSTTRGRRPKPAIVLRTTTLPALLEPAVPNSEPRPLISVSALKLSEGTLVTRASSAMVGELCSASDSAAAGVRPIFGPAPTVTPRRRSALSNSRAAKRAGLFWKHGRRRPERPRLKVSALSGPTSLVTR